MGGAECAPHSCSVANGPSGSRRRQTSGNASVRGLSSAIALRGPQEFLGPSGVAAKLTRCGTVDDNPMLHHHDFVCERKRGPQILLDQQDRWPFPAKTADDVDEALYHRRRQALRRFVKEQKAWI